MIILSINLLHGDASAAIAKDGRLIFAIEEERLKRIKHWAGVPLKAVQGCLSASDVALDEIDYIVLAKNPFVHIGEKILLSIKNPPVKTASRLKANINILKIKDYLRQNIPKSGRIKARVAYVEHHKAHIAGAYFGSSFKEGLILSCDGTGDMRTTMWATAKDGDISFKGSINFPHSLGFLYTAFTQFLGFPEYGDEYKVMGLAPYGKPAYKKELYRIIKLRSNGTFALDLSYFDINKESASMTWTNCKPSIGKLYSDKMIKYFGKPRTRSESIDERYRDIACSLQEVLDEVLLNLVQILRSRYEYNNLCLTGGVFANSVICGKISDLKIFQEIYVPPAPGDAGTSIGALAYFYHKKTGESLKEISSPFKGPEYTGKEIRRELESLSLKYEEMRIDKILDFAVERLLNKEVVGWFQGRMEFGYRALGNRSILTHPGFADMKDILNKRIKNRESFRPFAPSVMEEHASDFFYVNNKSPYMSFVAKVKEDKIDKIKAVVHVDNTARIQTVSREGNPIYHNLLDRFYKKTGLPLLLNTSFNESEPIVNTPKEAIDCFLRTRMDVLVLGNFVIIK